MQAKNNFLPKLFFAQTSNGVNKKFAKGQVSTTLIIIAVVLFVAIVVVYFAIRFSSGSFFQPKAEPTSEEQPLEPVYEVTIGDVRFLFESAEDLGSVLSSEFLTSTYKSEEITTEKFIRVVVRAQNKGKTDLKKFSWDIKNIVDSVDRNFPPSDRAYNFLPKPDLCGAVLKPEFEPTPCVKIYEVSKVSTNLKLEVTATGQNGKKQTEYIDLKVNGPTN